MKEKWKDKKEKKQVKMVKLKFETKKKRIGEGTSKI